MSGQLTGEPVPREDTPAWKCPLVRSCAPLPRGERNAGPLQFVVRGGIEFSGTAAELLGVSIVTVLTPRGWRGALPS